MPEKSEETAETQIIRELQYDSFYDEIEKISEKIKEYADRQGSNLFKNMLTVNLLLFLTKSKEHCQKIEESK